MAAHATHTLAKIPAAWALKQSGLNQITQYWQLTGSFILDGGMLGITRDGSFISHNHQSAKIYSCVSSQIVPQNCCHCTPRCGIRPKFRSVVWQYFIFPSVSLLAVLQQDLCLDEKFLERVFDKGLTPHSVRRKVNFRMLMIVADDLGLGTNSACFPVLVTLRDAPIAPYLKVRMVNFKVFSAYSGHS